MKGTNSDSHTEDRSGAQRLTNSFVIKDVCDYWKNYTYHQRYMDSLASIFAVQKPVTAIAYFPPTQKFYLSYNTEASPIAVKKINIIQKWLNKSSEEILQKTSLLFLYITYNTDFKENLEKLKSPDKIFINIDNDQCIITSDYVNKTPEEIKRILFIQLEKKEQRKQKLDEKEKEITLKINDLVGSISNFNKLKQPIDPDTILQLQKDEGAGNFLSPRNKNLLESYKTAISSYFKLLYLLKEVDTSDKSNDFFDFAKVLLRPLQDVEKVLYYLDLTHGLYSEQSKAMELTLAPMLTNLFDTTMPNKSGYIKTDIQLILGYLYGVIVEPLANPNSAHAEVNLAREFPHLRDFYIGVSRLCCGLCDHLLDEIYHHKHCGTHGTADDGWHPPLIQFSNVFEELRSKSTNFHHMKLDDQQITLNRQVSKQHRQLSHDNLQALLQTEEPSLFAFQLYKDILLTGEDSISE